MGPEPKEIQGRFWRIFASRPKMGSSCSTITRSRSASTKCLRGQTDIVTHRKKRAHSPAEAGPN